MRELKGKSKGSVVNNEYTNYSSNSVRGASVQCAEKYSVSVRSKKCLRIQCSGRYSVCTQVTKYAEKKREKRKHTTQRYEVWIKCCKPERSDVMLITFGWLVTV